MPVTPTITVEATFGNEILDAEGNAILDAEGNAILDGGWVTDVFEDMRMSVPVHIKKGNFGGEPKDRVADIGSMVFAMDNSEKNSAELLGYYSPSNDNCRSGFGEETTIRLKMAYGGDTKYKFQGIRLDVVDPSSGTFGKRITHVTAVDWMEEASIQPADYLSLQENKRDDQLLETLRSGMRPPEDFDFDIGPDTYPIAFADVQSESDKVMGLFQSVMQSGLGKLFLVGDASTGEKLIYLNRGTLVSKTVPVATLDNTMVEVKAPRKARSRVKRVEMVTHPVKVDVAATTVLFETTQEYEIYAGETLIFTGRYRDPSGANTRIVGVDFVTPLVAGTHFNFSSVSGSGSDLNGDVEVTVTAYADYAQFSFKNNAAVTGYLQSGMQLLGKGVYRYDSVAVVAEDTNIHKGEELNIDMPYQTSLITGGYAADFMLGNESVADNERPVVHFIANTNATLMAAAINVEPTDLVVITETVTGIDKYYFVDGIEMSIRAGGRSVHVWWYCTPAYLYGTTQFCILDKVGYAELDETAYLFF